MFKKNQIVLYDNNGAEMLGPVLDIKKNDGETIYSVSLLGHIRDIPENKLKNGENQFYGCKYKQRKKRRVQKID